MTKGTVARGIALFLLATICFTLMDLMAKLLSSRVETVQTLWARYTVQMVVVTAICAPRLAQVVATKRLKLQLFRATVLMLATAFFFTAFQRVSLVEVTAMMQISPILIMLGAAIFLGERFGPRRAVAAAIALCGALIILRPGTASFSFWLLLPLAGTVFYSAYALATRLAGRDEDVWTSLFYTGTVATLLLTALVPFFWQPLEWGDLPYLVAVGGFGTLGQLFLIRAHVLAQASVLAPFTYSALIWSTLWGITFFGEFPTLPVYIGAAVIVAAGLYVWRRETGKDARAA